MQHLSAMKTLQHHDVLTPREEESQCGASGGFDGYNTGLHIFALFLIMTCGTLACVFLTAVKAFPRLAISKHALFVCRHFGTGVLVALAFCHLLPTAFENLWDDCLAYFWTEGYGAMPGFIAMIAALTVALVEMGFTWAGLGSHHVLHSSRPEMQPKDLEPERTSKLAGQNDDNVQYTDAGKKLSLTCANGEQCEEDLICPCDVSEQGRPAAATAEDHVTRDAAFTGAQGEITRAKERRMILQCLLLESGILFHSVFIGLSISLSTGTTFIALMAAISFHQIFEGLALGARIAAIPSFRVSSPKPWVMSIAYRLTCPLGQAIGLGVRETYAPEGQTGLLAVGIANAISAGMIMYAGLVPLLGEDLLSEQSYSQLTGRARLESVVSLVAGALLMAMIAIWA